MCEHSPVTPDDCTPHKSLRTTIKVFLRTEEKKRGALLAKAAKETPPDTPIEAAPPPPAPLPEAAVSASQEQPTEDVQPAIEGHDGTPAPAPEAEVGEGRIKEEIPSDTALSIIPPREAQDIPHESIEVRLAPANTKANHKVKRGPPNQAVQEIAPGQEQDEDRSCVDDAELGAPAEASTEASAGTGGASGMNPMMTGGMNPMMGMMGMNGMGEMNQMQQMQMMMAMQGGFGGFGMMGMSFPSFVLSSPLLPLPPNQLYNQQVTDTLSQECQACQ